MGWLRNALFNRARIFSTISLRFVLLGLAAVAVGCGGHTSVPGLDQRHLGRQPMFVVQPHPNGLFFGAQVNPSASPGDYSAVELETEGLETSINRPLAFHNEYRTWSQLAGITSDSSDPEIAGDIAHGRVPVIALQCQDNLQNPPLNLNQIANNQAAVNDLGLIKTALSNLDYTSGPARGKAYPVMLRWFWEFNLNAVGPGNENNNGGCFTGSDSTQYPSQFINAWKAIYAQLVGHDTGVPNITFVWNPNVSKAFSDGAATDAQPFWPGSAYVDWIGVDGYSKEPAGGGNPALFDDIFHGFFEEFASYGKPMMITETGSCQQYTGKYTQEAYIADAANQITLDSLYIGSVNAFMYFDGHSSQYQIPNIGPCKWVFDSNGLQAFTTMGSEDPFRPMVTPAP